MNLDGQTAIVTGAGSAEGIGFAIARRLHAMGAHVAITSTTERIQERGRELDAGRQARDRVCGRPDARSRGTESCRRGAAAHRTDRYFGEQCRNDADRSSYREHLAAEFFLQGLV